MDPKKMLQKLSLLGRNISVLIGTNEGVGQRDLKKLLPLIAAKLAKETPAVPWEVFEEALQKIFPTASEQVKQIDQFDFIFYPLFLKNLSGVGSCKISVCQHIG